MTIPVNRYWSLLRQYLTPQWRRVLCLAVLLFSLNGSRVINPQIIRSVILVTHRFRSGSQVELFCLAGTR
jgi:hypothetical protein